MSTQTVKAARLRLRRFAAVKVYTNASGSGFTRRVGVVGREV
jgi:hypothetical protein